MKIIIKPRFSHVLALLAALAAQVITAEAQGTAITYQGRLYDGANPANGTYDLQFSLYTASSVGSLVAGPITNSPVTVSNGLFVVTLDFGAGIFTGPVRWLEIGARSNTVAVAFTVLSPRQPLNPTPYAIFAEGANAAGLTGTIPASDLSGTYGGALTLNNAGNSFTGNGAGLANVDALTLGGLGPNNFWKTGGNAGTTAGVNFLGTTDGQPLELHVGANRVMRFDGGSGTAPNLVGGANNSIGNLLADGNFIGGGYNNSVGNYRSFSSVVGGFNNVIDCASSFIGGGAYNYVGGNSHETIGGGEYNTNTGQYATIPGGYHNIASGAESFAAGQNAQALHGGSFVWADDSTSTPLATTGVNQFLVRAAGGMTFLTSSMLDVHDPTAATGTIHVGTGATGGDPKLVKFGDGDYVHVGENGADDRMELKAGTFFFTHTSFESGFVGINTATPSQPLEVNGAYILVDGNGGEKAYIGGDGAGSDVQIGSLAHGISAVACYNATDGTYMHLYCSSITIEGGADLAEPFKITSGDEEIPQGAVVVIDDQNPGHLKLSDQPYDTRVAGVVSGANGINPGIQMQQQGVLEGGKNVALTGRVYVQADVSNGAIRPGDMLTTSAMPGCAMKVSDHARAAGAILGKAMTGLSTGKGMVLVLVTLQ